jgi:hypothetical protein
MVYVHFIRTSDLLMFHLVHTHALPTLLTLWHEFVAFSNRLLRILKMYMSTYSSHWPFGLLSANHKGADRKRFFLYLPDPDDQLMTSPRFSKSIKRGFCSVRLVTNFHVGLLAFILLLITPTNLRTNVLPLRRYFESMRVRLEFLAGR